MLPASTPAMGHARTNYEMDDAGNMTECMGICTNKQYMTPDTNHGLADGSKEACTYTCTDFLQHL